MIIMKIIMIAVLTSAQTPLAGTVSFILLKNNAMTVTILKILILMAMGAHKIVKLSMAINVLTIPLPVSVHKI